MRFIFSISAKSYGEPCPLASLSIMFAEERGADAARRAEPAALVREEVHEVARHLEHVAARVEHHQRARGRQVLEADAPAELRRRHARARRAAHLHRLRALGAAVLEHLPHLDAERVLVDAGTRAVAGHAQQLRAGRLRRADARVPRAALQGHEARRGEGLHVVHHRGLAEVAARSPGRAGGCAACRACPRATR